jgi:hypothetical protein
LLYEHILKEVILCLSGEIHILHENIHFDLPLLLPVDPLLNHHLFKKLAVILHIETDTSVKFEELFVNLLEAH